MTGADDELLARLYADAGGVAGVPEALRACLPRHKADLARVTEAAQLGFPAIASIVPHLLVWLQDRNWPISDPVANLLADADAGAALEAPIRAVLRSRDDVWKLGVLSCLVQGCAPLRAALEPELRRLADAPSPGERAEEVDQLAREILR